jgi:hypothetical protein
MLDNKAMTAAGGNIDCLLAGFMLCSVVNLTGKNYDIITGGSYSGSHNIKFIKILFDDQT